MGKVAAEIQNDNKNVMQLNMNQQTNMVEVQMKWVLVHKQLNLIKEVKNNKVEGGD